MKISPSSRPGEYGLLSEWEKTEKPQKKGKFEKGVKVERERANIQEKRKISENGKLHAEYSIGKKSY
jgi:hypothetical protein